MCSHDSSSSIWRKLTKAAMDVGLDRSDGLARGDRDLFVAKADHVSQDNRPTRARRKALEPSMPGVEVDELRVFGRHLDLSVDELGPAALARRWLRPRLRAIVQIHPLNCRSRIRPGSYSDRAR